MGALCLSGVVGDLSCIRFACLKSVYRGSPYILRNRMYVNGSVFLVKLKEEIIHERRTEQRPWYPGSG